MQHYSRCVVNSSSSATSLRCSATASCFSHHVGLFRSALCGQFAPSQFSAAQAAQNVQRNSASHGHPQQVRQPRMPPALLAFLQFFQSSSRSSRFFLLHSFSSSTPTPLKRLLDTQLGKVRAITQPLILQAAPILPAAIPDK